jgi:hypothetical protein
MMANSRGVPMEHNRSFDLFYQPDIRQLADEKKEVYRAFANRTDK